LHLALGRDVQGHGRSALQTRLQGVAALGQPERVDIQAVVLSVIGVLGPNIGQRHRRAALPAQLVHLQIQLQGQGQAQLGQGCEGLGRALVLHAQALDLDALEGPGLSPQLSPVQHQLCILSLHLQTIALPADLANATALLQVALHIGAAQLLARGQGPVDHVQGGAQRSGGARPGPQPPKRGSQRQGPQQGRQADC
jgi:hypothetical protein